MTTKKATKKTESKKTETPEATEEKKPGSVVKSKYKAIYRANETRGRGNGDTLYTWMRERCLTPEGQTDVEALDALCEANGIDGAKYRKTTNGWQGRYRMTVGNILRNRILKDEPVFDLNGKPSGITEIK